MDRKKAVRGSDEQKMLQKEVGYFFMSITTLPLPPGEAKEPGRDDDQDEIKDEEPEQHPNVSPPILVPDIQRDEKVLSNGVRTVPTSGGIVRVVEVSTKRRHELVRPGAARLARWWLKHRKLVGFTLDLESMKLGGDHRSHDASERVKVIQPRPRPSADIGIGNSDATEGGEDGHDERVDQHGGLDGGRDGADELRKGDTEQLDEDDHEELEPDSVETRSTLSESARVDHQDPIQDAAENGIWNLSDQLGNGESLGRVDTTVVFADEDHPVHDPQRRQLGLDDSGKNTRPEAVVSVSKRNQSTEECKSYMTKTRD